MMAPYEYFILQISQLSCKTKEDIMRKLPYDTHMQIYIHISNTKCTLAHHCKALDIDLANCHSAPLRYLV